MEEALIVAIEGPDNAGKTTLCAALAERLSDAHQLDVATFTSVDFSRPSGPRLRELMDAVTNAGEAVTREQYIQLHLAFVRNRYEALASPEGRKILGEADVILFDRHALSGIVYADLDDVCQVVGDVECAIGTYADITLMLSVSAEVAMSRETFGDGFREAEDYQVNSCLAFAQFSGVDYPPAGDIVVIDGSLTETEVLAKAERVVLKCRKY